MRSTGQIGVTLAALGCLAVACTGAARGSSTADPTDGPGTAPGASPASPPAVVDPPGPSLDDSARLPVSPTTRTPTTRTDTAGATTQGAGPLPDIDLSAIAGDPQDIVDRVDLDRLIADIAVIAKGPRHAVDDHAAALEAADYVTAEFTAAGLAPESIDVTAFGVTLPTVWVEIVGKRCADQAFVVTAHYDTVAGSPGADDDASGVAAVLEAARVLADAELPATVVLAAVPFEEFGESYHGAAALADELLAHDREVRGMFSAEMLGYARAEPDADGDPGDYLFLIGYPGAESLVATYSAAGRAWAHGFGNRPEISTEAEGYVQRSDHKAFHYRGIPAAFATDGANFRTPYYHRADDVPENIVGDFLLGSVRTLVGGTIAVATVGLDGTGASCGTP